MFKVIGMSDNQICDCCGRKGLKRTVAVEIESGEIQHYGTTCASKKHGVKTQPKHLMEIEFYANKAENIGEFIRSMNSQGFSASVLSPLTNDAPEIQWHWGDVKISASRWAA